MCTHTHAHTHTHTPSLSPPTGIKRFTDSYADILENSLSNFTGVYDDAFNAMLNVYLPAVRMLVGNNSDFADMAHIPFISRLISEYDFKYVLVCVHTHRIT